MNRILFVFTVLAVAGTQMLAGRGRFPALYLPGCGILAVVAVLSWWPKRRAPIPQEAGECLAASTLFFAYIAVRAFFSPEEYLARNDLFFALGAITLYFLFALNFTSSRMRLWFVGVLLALGLANCAIGAVQFFRGQNFMPFGFLPRPDYGWRASGFYSYPNYLAGFLEVAGLMGLAAAFWSRSVPWVKMIAGYVSLAILAGIVLTGSRGGYISITVGLFVFGLLSLVLVGKVASNRAVPLIFAGAILVGGIGFAVYHFLSKSYLLHTRAAETLTVESSRIQMWEAAWKQSRLRPIVGTGSGTYLYFGRQLRNLSMQLDPVHAHDDYFELLAEYGLLGIIAMVIFLETHLRHGWTFFREKIAAGAGPDGLSSNSLALTIGGLSAVAAMLTHSFLDFNLHNFTNLLVIAFVFAVLGHPERGAQSTGAAGLPGFFRLALPALGLWIALQALPTLPAEIYAEQARPIALDWHLVASPEVADKLEALARKGIAWDARNPGLHFDLAAALDAKAAQAKNPENQKEFQTQAIAEHQRALELAPGDVFYVLNLAWALAGAHQNEEADALFRRALDLDPNSGQVQSSYASHMEAVGNFAEAEAHFRRALQLGGGAASVEALERLDREKKQRQSLPGHGQDQPSQ